MPVQDVKFLGDLTAARADIDKAGIQRDDVGTIVTAASDVFHSGISCANSDYWEASGGFLKNAGRRFAVCFSLCVHAHFIGTFRDCYGCCPGQCVSGVWNRSDATAQAIKQGWLCTGDLARQDQDGDILLWIAKKISL